MQIAHQKNMIQGILWIKKQKIVWNPIVLQVPLQSRNCSFCYKWTGAMFIELERSCILPPQLFLESSQFPFNIFEVRDYHYRLVCDPFCFKIYYIFLFLFSCSVCYWLSLKHYNYIIWIEYMFVDNALKIKKISRTVIEIVLLLAETEWKFD